MGGGSSSSRDTELATPPLPTPTLIPRLPPQRFGNLITVLSIDGGGIRGLIPAVVLNRLEKKLQHFDGQDARIGDYFDVIAGTSTGALIAAMLVVPDDTGRPKFGPEEIKDFYIDNGPKIFPRWPGLVGEVGVVFRSLWGPRYDGTFLRDKIKKVIDKDTLGNLVVPTFDINRMKPTIFYRFGQEEKQNSKPELSLPDICIGTSAAPVYLRPHSFNHAGKSFHLIDGGVVANNPTMAAIMAVTRDQVLRKKNPYFQAGGADYKKYLVISIGTGSAVKENGDYYTEDSCASWSAIRWAYNIWNNDKPITDIFQHANAALVDWQVRMLLHNTDNSNDKQNYLRIQAQRKMFGESMSALDDVTKENMTRLVDIGNKLLTSKLAMVDLQIGYYRTVKDDNASTNDQELDRYARLLSAERKLRLEREQQEEEEKKDNNDEVTPHQLN